MTIEQHNIDLQTVEQQLLLKGAFCPLHWLQDSGLLPYGDYERWRYGELDTLEQAVTCERGVLLALLQNAQRHAQSLKLVNDAQIYHDWRPGHAMRELALSRDRDLARALSQRWLRPQDAPQLDLFMDSGAASAENELIDHLAGRHWPEAEAAYGRLCEVAPNNTQLGGYETLVLYGKHIGAKPDTDAPGLVDELAGLEEDIVPLAHDLLRGRARDYLAPAWQRLARNLPVDPFDTRQPALHASHAWAQIPDWPRVIECVEATPDYPDHFELLERLALGLYYGGREEVALLLWAYLFELAPERAEDRIDTQAIAPLRHYWRRFSGSEKSHPLAHFPAWLLLQAPGLVHHLDITSYPAPKGEAFRACATLLRIRAEGGDEVPARAALQTISSGLLRAYLQRQDMRATT